MNTWAAERSFIALRTRAFVLLAWGSGLWVSEVIALNICDVLNMRLVSTRRRFCIASKSVLPNDLEGAWAGNPSRPPTFPTFIIPPDARAALKEYISYGVRAGLLAYPSGALFVRSPRSETTARGRAQARIGIRSAQRMWDELQAYAKLEQHYRTDDLRVDAIARFAARAHGDVHRIKAFARFADIRTATSYVPEQAAG